jgi:hypothetical protein
MRGKKKVPKYRNPRLWAKLKARNGYALTSDEERMLGR